MLLGQRINLSSSFLSVNGRALVPLKAIYTTGGPSRFRIRSTIN